MKDWLSNKFGRQIVEVRDLDRTASGTLNGHAFLDVLDSEGHVQRLVTRKALSPAFPGRNANAVQHQVQEALTETGALVPRSVGVFEDRHIMYCVDGNGDPEQIVGEGVSPDLIRNLTKQIALCHGTSFASPGLEDWRQKSEALLDAAPDCREHSAFAKSVDQAAGFVERICLVHNDFRTGNFLVAGGNLAAVLDFDLACIGDPLMDLAWFCAPRWRYQRQDQEAGGLCPLDDFLKAYEDASGRNINPAAFAFWRGFALARTDLMRLVQANRGFIWKEK